MAIFFLAKFDAAQIASILMKHSSPTFHRAYDLVFETFCFKFQTRSKLVGTVSRYLFSCRRKHDVENYVMEQETRRLQDLESAVFNEFRKDVRKKLRRHSRSGRPSIQKSPETDR